MSGGAYPAAHFRPMTVDSQDENTGPNAESLDEKVRKFAESYRLFPQTQEEIDELAEWEEIQYWEE